MTSEFYGTDYPDFEEFGPAPCASSWPDAFFSDDAPEGSITRRGTYTMEREAKLTCMECPYRVRCLKYALDHPDLVGIWGGTTEYQRKAIRAGVPIHIGIPSNRNR